MLAPVERQLNLGQTKCLDHLFQLMMKIMVAQTFLSVRFSTAGLLKIATQEENDNNFEVRFSTYLRPRRATMHSSMPDRSLGTGAYYDQKDYARLHHRLGIILIDSVTLYVMVAMGLSICLGIWPDRMTSQMQALVAIALIWGYLAGLKWMGISSFGYRVMRCRVVDLQGKRLTIWRATFRETMWLIMAGSFIIDLGWCGIDDARQSLRDCWSGTILIRNKAQPAGAAPLHLTRIFALCYPFFYPRITCNQVRLKTSANN